MHTSEFRQQTCPLQALLIIIPRQAPPPRPSVQRSGMARQKATFAHFAVPFMGFMIVGWLGLASLVQTKREVKVSSPAYVRPRCCDLPRPLMLSLLVGHRPTLTKPWCPQWMDPCGRAASCSKGHEAWTA